MPSEDPDFSTNVFINCPFDSKYVSLLRPLLFTVCYLRLTPRIASERLDSGEPRIDKIVDLIERSRFSIHDLSRIESFDKGQLYRLNMAFELGIDIGCKRFAAGVFNSKKILVLEKEKYRYQRALSDISGSDIRSHNEEPEEIVRELRNWFVESESISAPSGTRIWESFNEFMADFYEQREKQGYRGKDLETMPTSEYVRFIVSWLDESTVE